VSTRADKAQAILAAAQRVFALRGFSQTRIEDIAQEAGVGKGTVYEYFPSKKAVFEQAVEAGMSRYMDNLIREIAVNCSPQEKLRRISVVHLQFIAEHRNIARIIISDPAIMSSHRGRLIKISRLAQQLVADVIKQGIDAGVLRSVDTLFAAQAFIGVLSSIGGTYLVEQQPWEPEAVAAAVTDIVVYGLAAAGNN
jgi:AcrR family transcriptional regulator